MILPVLLSGDEGRNLAIETYAKYPSSPPLIVRREESSPLRKIRKENSENLVKNVEISRQSCDSLSDPRERTPAVPHMYRGVLERAAIGTRLLAARMIFVRRVKSADELFGMEARGGLCFEDGATGCKEVGVITS
mmetsp:Transcript_26690/g.42341  ORF Transcript_26690/g.42341 Transcript_26690/m.42341 type:complete len:135 (-) Transcript_26690:213-617(-)